jgi:hypothetical protein
MEKAREVLSWKNLAVRGASSRRNGKNSAVRCGEKIRKKV